MTIRSYDDYLAAQRQIITIAKTTSASSYAAWYHDVLAVAGIPGSGTLGGTNTANGVVPTDATDGFPKINDFTEGATGYITRIVASNSVTSRIRLCDMLFKAGAYSFPADTTLSSQPSFSSRLPLRNGNPDYGGLEVWIESTSSLSGNIGITIDYLDQDGNASTTGEYQSGLAMASIGQMMQIPLANVDSGVQAITHVSGWIATGGGSFNVLILRPIWMISCPIVGYTDIASMMELNMPVIFDDSALMLQVSGHSTATGLPSVMVEVSHG